MSCWQDVGFYLLYSDRLSNLLSNRKILYFGILGNILLGSGTAYLLEKGLNRKYQNWIPKEDAYYREWRAEMKKMEHLLQVIGILAFAAASIFFVLQSKFRVLELVLQLCCRLCDALYSIDSVYGVAVCAPTV